MTDPRYPVGRFEADADVTSDKRGRWIAALAAAPQGLRAAVSGLNDSQLDTPYREGGWTVRQVVHHVADSHLNAYVRFRLAVTEQEPTVKAYDESEWAKLPDARTAPIDVSLALLDALHTRWVMLLGALSPEQFGRAIRHPQHGTITLDTLLQMYAWHGRHHAAHVTALRQRQQW